MKNKKKEKKIKCDLKCVFLRSKVSGFTIIETMIAVSLFLVIVTIGIGALLNSTMLHGKSQDMRSVMDNLSFIMEDISKNLRTGYDFHCIDDGNVTSTTPHSCVNGSGISFKSSSDTQWVYVVSSDGIQKSVTGGASGTFTTLTPPEIKIDSLSNFAVFGAEAPPGDTRQPFITIRLTGTITSSNNVVTPFSIQTSVSGRLVDISN